MPKGHYAPLSTDFRHDGFILEQVKRTGDVALYRKHRGGAVSFEVIKVKRSEGFAAFGKVVPPAEHYPRNEAWGADGWTYSSIEAALARFRGLVRERRRA